MIKSVHLKNYRCFSDTKVEFKNMAILVGKNNAGKSTLIEALRLIALALKKSKHTVYKELPKDFGLPIREFGFRLETEKLKIDLRGIVYRYNDGFATVETYFDDCTALYIYANTNYAYAVLHNINGKCIKNMNQIMQMDKDTVSILPQIGLIKENEQKLSEDTVDRERETYLSSRHFRNEVYKYKNSYWNEFVELSQETWKGLRIYNIEYLSDENLVRLFIADSGFSAEIGLMGSGLQMWLQIMWFLSRTQGDKTIILDEPDVYMHPDLQRKLIRIVKERYPQVIIATHSVEIISEVDPTNVLLVDKNRKLLCYSSDMEAVQSILDDMGEVNNLSLIRLGSARKCIFVEGKDLKLLSRIADIINNKKNEPLDILPHVSVGGFNNLRNAFGAAMLFDKETNGMIKCFGIFDRDYFPEKLIEDKCRKAKESKLSLHIWKRKEIENYLIEPNVLFRLSKLPSENYDFFLKQIDERLDRFKDRVCDQYAEQLHVYDKKLSISDVNFKARSFVNEHWTTIEEKIKLVGGKEFIKDISDWYNLEYGIHLSIPIIISEFRPEEFDNEMIKLIEELIK